MKHLREDVRDRLAVVQTRRKELYNKRSEEAPYYKKGEVVLIYRPRRKKGLAEKLLHQGVGPYKVTRRITGLNYELRKPGGRQPIIVHVSQMKKFVAGEGSTSET